MKPKKFWIQTWWYQTFLIIQSNLAIRNFLFALKLFLNAKSSLSLWSKWQIGHRKWFLNTNLFPIKPFLIAKFDWTLRCSGVICYWIPFQFFEQNPKSYLTLKYSDCDVPRCIATKKSLESPFHPIKSIRDVCHKEKQQ